MPTFMPKPLYGENGSGMHTHQSLFSNGSRLLRRRRPVLPVDVGKAFIAGQLKHAREICSIFAQWSTPTSAGAGLRGSGLRRVVAAQRSAARARAAYHRGIGEGHAHGASLPGPPRATPTDLRRAAAGGLEGIEKGYELPDRWRRTSTTSPARSAGAWASSTLRRASAKRSSDAQSELVLRTLGEHMFQLATCRSSRQEWDDYRVQVTQWERTATCRFSSQARAPERAQAIGRAGERYSA